MHGPVVLNESFTRATLPPSERSLSTNLGGRRGLAIPPPPEDDRGMSLSQSPPAYHGERSLLVRAHIQRLRSCSRASNPSRPVASRDSSSRLRSSVSSTPSTRQSTSIPTRRPCSRPRFSPRA